MTGGVMMLCAAGVSDAGSQPPLTTSEAEQLAAALGTEIVARLRGELPSPSGAAAIGGGSLRHVELRASFGCEDAVGARCTTLIDEPARQAADSVLRASLRRSLGDRFSSGAPPAAAAPPTSPVERSSCRDTFAAAPIAIGVTDVRRREAGYEVDWYRMDISRTPGCESGGAALQTAIQAARGSWISRSTRVLVYY